MKRIGTIAGLGTLTLALIVVAQDALPKGVVDAKKPESLSRSALLRKALNTRIDIPEEFRKPGQAILLKQALQYLTEKLSNINEDLIVVIRNETFRGESDDPLDLLESSVTFPPFHRNMTVQEALEICLAQVPGSNATYLIKNGRFEILADRAARIGFLLDQSMAIQFREFPLKLAIEEIGDRAGVTIMIDPRCGTDLNNSVSLNTKNDISVRGILSSWADTYGWKMIVDDHRVTIMPRTEHLKNLQLQADEAELEARIMKAKGIVPAPKNSVDEHRRLHLQIETKSVARP